MTTEQPSGLGDKRDEPLAVPAKPTAPDPTDDAPPALAGTATGDGEPTDIPVGDDTGPANVPATADPKPADVPADDEPADVSADVAPVDDAAGGGESIGPTARPDAQTPDDGDEPADAAASGPQDGPAAQDPAAQDPAAQDDVFASPGAAGQDMPPPPGGPSFAGPRIVPPGTKGFATQFGLVRPVQGRYVAGVCAALGRATNTDPIMWRVLLPVLTLLGGLGALVYALGWLLIPADGDTGSPMEALAGQGRSSTPRWATICLIVFSVCAMIGGLTHWGGGGFLVIAAVAALVLVAMSRRDGWPTFGGTQPGGGTPNWVGSATSGWFGPVPPATPGAVPPATGLVPPAPFRPVPPAAGGVPADPAAGGVSAGPAAGGVSADTAAGGVSADPAATTAPSPVGWPGTETADETAVPAAPTVAASSRAGAVTTPIEAPYGGGFDPFAPATLPPTALPGPISPGAVPTQPIPTYQPPFAPGGPFAGSSGPPEYSDYPPVPVPPIPPRKRSAARRLILSAVLVVAGVMGALDVTNAASIPATAYFAAALLTIGIGLIVCAFFGRVRGPITLGVLLVFALLLATAGSGVRVRGGRDGEQTYTPRSVADVQKEYHGRFGDLTVDLSHVDLATAAPLSIDASMQVGELVVIVPPNVDVTVDARVRVGDVTTFDNTASGIGRTVHTTDEGPDGAGGGTLTIHANVRIGDIEVKR